MDLGFGVPELVSTSWILPRMRSPHRLKEHVNTARKNSKWQAEKPYTDEDSNSQASSLNPTNKMAALLEQANKKIAYLERKVSVLNQHEEQDGGTS